MGSEGHFGSQHVPESEPREEEGEEDQRLGSCHDMYPPPNTVILEEAFCGSQHTKASVSGCQPSRSHLWGHLGLWLGGLVSYLIVGWGALWNPHDGCN